MTNHKKEELIKAIEATPVIEADFMFGLTMAQVEERKKAGFVNKMPKKVTKTYWQIFFDNFFTFFNLVFFGIAILMAIAQINIKAYFFLLPILCNIVLGLITDIRARRLVDKLRLVTDPKAKVVREGKQADLPIDEIVLNDIVVLSTGDQICADALVVNGTINVNESLLTGESDAVIKPPSSQILSGSYVVSGKAYVRTNRVGIANCAEGLQDSAKRFERPNSELKSSSLKIFWTTGAIAILLGLAMAITWSVTTFSKGGSVNYYEEYQKFISQTLSGSLEAMIPAGLYLLTSLTLGVGVINLAKKRMNVQELYSLEMLARTDVICFDKTGTLTDENLSVKSFINLSKLSDADIQEHLASLCQATGDDNPTAKAIKSAYKAPYEAKEIRPFDSTSKFSAAYFEGTGTYLLGAPGFVDALSNSAADQQIASLAEKGYRVMGIYFNKKPLKKGEILEKSLLVALICLADHVKPDASKTIGWFRDNGVGIKVISGDNPITVAEIAGEVGVPNAERYVEMSKVKNEEIPALVEHYSVFGRVNPEQKALLIAALRAKGHKVAMTGDGVNDILALKGADCSIAMASGSSAARNVAHIVSLDSDFSKLPDVVAEGRRVINNLQRTATLFLTKTVFAIVLTIIFLISSWFPQGLSYPFSTNNMYVWEIVTIGGGGLFLSLQPSKERLSGSYLRNVLSKAAPGGLACVLAVLIYFVAFWVSSPATPAVFEANYEAARTLSVFTFTALSYCVLFRASLPFDRYRTIVFVAMLFFGALFFLLDVYFTNINPLRSWREVFDITYQITFEQLVLGIVTLVAMIGAYFLLDWGSRHISAKNDLRNGGQKS